jgi:hypothetical protein
VFKVGFIGALRLIKKETIVERVREIAKANGGKVSFRNFVQETGIPGQRLRKQEWFQGWNRLLEESGVSTSSFARPSIPREFIAANVIRIAERLGRWPTEDELAREKKVNASFPSLSLIRTLKKSGALSSIIKEYCRQFPASEVIQKVVGELGTTEHLADAAIDKQGRIQGYVYMLRYGRKYKIGHTTTLARRFRDVKIELPEETIQVHAIATDDPKGIEAYWHTRFSAKQIRKTEWFELNADDVRSFKRRRYQ